METYKSKFNVSCHSVFNENSIVCTDIIGESKINLSIIEEIIEIKDYIYLKIKTGGYFILPKSKIENVTEVQINLASLAEKLKINYTKELEWKWK
ncbi:YcxB family protein [Flavobacterium capsici]|uniref:YcxB family protein n=1 Tax=Flavobacterium capsici TaxID=3075618 RepID=A0AA96F5E1_9FLAO|nr:YcxB family protein [Flavobacterium sp. PMTSA4]WNM23117.1 YcxB family protein [Flavobacterium sp. PMTSA4]